MAIGTGEQAREKRRAIVAEPGFERATPHEARTLLAPDEPPAFEIINDGGSARLLLVCDHASRRIPRRLDNLGLDELALRRHIACDIGAADVTRRLQSSSERSHLHPGGERRRIRAREP
jgi:hypothetical protein